MTWRERLAEWNRQRLIKKNIDRFIEHKQLHRYWATLAPETMEESARRNVTMGKHYAVIITSLEKLVDLGVPMDVWNTDKNGRSYKILSDKKRSYINRMVVK